MKNLSLKSKIISVAVIISVIGSILAITLITLQNNSIDEGILGNPEIVVSGEYYDGYNLFVLGRKDMRDYSILDRTLYLTDMEGNVLIEKDLGLDASMNVEFINSTTILYGNYFGAVLWNIETNVTKQLGFKGHHDYERNEANDTYFTLQTYMVEYLEIEYRYDRIAEYTPNGILVWSVNMSDFVPIIHWCPFEDYESGGVVDITHANSVAYDPVYDVIYVNCRNTNTFYKIDHKTGDLIWSLGEYGDFILRDIYGNIKDNLFFHGHSLDKIDENTFIYFDNDEHNQSDNTNHQSRIIEITINEHSMTANTTFEFIAPKNYHTAWWGDADLLPNGNRLGVFGTHGHEGNTDVGARLVEVNSMSEIVWEMYFPNRGGVTGGVYRMERVSLELYLYKL